jgi:hypothetical protein
MSFFDRFLRPKSGKVMHKWIDEPRSRYYSELVGTKVINAEPIYWLYIDGGKRKGWVLVEKMDFDTVAVGSHWSK